ncbi:MAG TPA: universal stress protein [Thermodesulfovibrionales bacterium]|nr:universal stress protein [Thermodesulfovibrionales bacterium]
MKILVPVDGSRYSREALKVAVEFAKTRGAEICLLNVVTDFTDIDLEISAGERDRVTQRLESRGESIIQEARRMLEAEKVSADCRSNVVATSITDAIIDVAEKEKMDLIVIGSRGLSKSSRFKLGSVASKVVAYAPCSVYVVKLTSE